LGALIGALLAATGIHMLSTVLTIGFKFQQIPVFMVVLGLMSIYASSVGTDGVLHGSPGHMTALLAIIAFILLGETALMFETSMDPTSVANDLYVLWRSQYTANRRSLSWYESHFGCCGFKSPADMPSSNNCMRVSFANEPVLGCMHYMRESVFLQNKRVLRLVLAALVAQAVIVGVGYGLYNIAYGTDTTWIVEDFADDMEAGGGQGGQVVEVADEIEATAPARAAENVEAHEQTQAHNPANDTANDPETVAVPDTAAGPDTAGPKSQAKRTVDPPGSPTPGSKSSTSGGSSHKSQMSHDPWPPRTRTNKY
ncbi:hypothetical protein IW150_006900, partial [Coemansia sp. RSA 2607]